MNVESLELLVARFVLGLLRPEDLTAVAVAALEEGLDSPSLRSLAGLVRPQVGEARQIFDRVIVELQLSLFDKREALERLARESSRQILVGDVSPYEGAKEIWQLSLRVPEEHLPELDAFIYGASEWEDRPKDRSVFEAGIVEAARELSADLSIFQELPSGS